jgi:hypothetical protein
MANTTTFTVGRDAQAVLVAPNGTIIDMPLLTQIQTKPQYKRADSTPLNQPPMRRSLPAGHEVMLTFDRLNGNVELAFSQIELNWWAGGTPDGGGTNPTGALFVYVTNPDGSQTTRNYQGLSLEFTNAGDFTVDAPVKQEITAFASTCVVS